MNKNEISTQVKEAMKDGLNLQEISWCETYLRTLSIKQACTESGLSKKQADLMLNREPVMRYIMMRSDQHRIALLREKEEALDREKISKVLEGIIMNPLTKNDDRLRAISELNRMKQFDKENNIKPEEEQETKELKLSVDEAEALLKKMRSKNNKESK